MPRALAALALPVLAACGGGALRLTVLDASAARPSNVAVFFTVETDKGEPVPGLAAEQFRILEDEQPVSILESKQTILNQEVAATHSTLLLIDMSGSVTGSGDLPVIMESAQAFAERVQKYEKVAVYAFDGSPQLYPIVNFTTGPGLAAGIARLATFKPRDPSTNLNGAVVEALRLLDHRLASVDTPLSFGTLVVFTDGTDRAHRVSREQLHKELDQHQDLDVLVIGVGAEVDDHELSLIGREGAILSKDRSRIAAAFEDAAAKVEAYARRYYLLGYCSPARAGSHLLRIETSARGESGSLTYRFNADGFGPTCDPTRPPAFNTRRPRRAPAPAAPAGGAHF